jgi:phage portal protein BeeE
MLESNDPDTLLKAELHLKDVESRESSGVKSVIFDPEGISQGDGYLRKARPLTFGTLRAMARTPLISAIIKTRVEQVSEFTTPQADKFAPGFVIRKKKTSYFVDNKKVESNNGLQGRIDDMVKFILNCGEGSNQWHGDTFDSFTRKLIPDSLSLDQATFEVVRNRKGIPIEMIATDAATMRIADSYDDDEYKDRAEKRNKINGYYPSYVQVMDGTVRNEYFPWELCFGVRNPSTNIYNNGYGISELEEMMQIVTWMLNADQYNGKFFSQGSAPKGIMRVSGNVNGARLREFRQSWQSTTAGVQNAHKIPIVESENFEWIDLQRANRDMEFSQWQEYLIKVACAIYKIDPREVFDLQHTSSSALSGADKEESIKYSRDKGLKPLLKSYEAWLNKYIVNPRDQDLELVFVGLDVDSEERELELDIKRASNFMGVNEVRAKHDLKPLDDDDVILNPQYVAWQGQKMAGDPGSNDAMSEFDEGQFAGEGQGDDSEKSEESNPFVDELNAFVKKTLMN